LQQKLLLLLLLPPPLPLPLPLMDQALSGTFEACSGR